MGTSVSFDGFDELQNNLLRLGANATKVEGQALKAGAAILQEAMKQRAPRSPEAKIHAADHISISKVKFRDGTRYIMVGVERTDNSMFFYMKFHEYGTSKMSARPWAAPAAVESESGILNAMADAVKAGMGL
jgi:HK97 gp10 family phage protein